LRACKDSFQRLRILGRKSASKVAAHSALSGKKSQGSSDDHAKKEAPGCRRLFLSLQSTLFADRPGRALQHVFGKPFLLLGIEVQPVDRLGDAMPLARVAQELDRLAEFLE
jgi:hypothetical protein